MANSASRADDRSRLLQRIRVVLVRPRGAANVGAAARAMKNMGLRDLHLVAPAFRRPFMAGAMAVHAREIVQQARTVSTVAEAVADCQLAVGTTCRGGPYRDCTQSLDAVAGDLLEHASHGTVALLFGPEDHGLTNADLTHCQRLLSIPSDSAYASLNVAQAVLLCCYELRRAATSGSAAKPARPAAHAGAVELMLRRLQHALLQIGFLHPDNPEHVMLALRQLLGRTTLDEREVRILLGLARQIEWVAGARRRAEGTTSVDVGAKQWRT